MIAIGLLAGTTLAPTVAAFTSGGCWLNTLCYYVRLGEGDGECVAVYKDGPPVGVGHCADSITEIPLLCDNLQFVDCNIPPIDIVQA